MLAIGEMYGDGNGNDEFGLSVDVGWLMSSTGDGVNIFKHFDDLKINFIKNDAE